MMTKQSHCSLHGFVGAFLLACSAWPAVAQDGMALEITASADLEHDPSIDVANSELDGRKTLRISTTTGDGVVLLPISMADGFVEVEVNSNLVPDAPAGSRGFAGIAFRVQPDLHRYDAFYIRPGNGRAEEQIRRNHATQYISHPDYTWFRLREEKPGHYESYVDIELGTWTSLRVEVEGDRARFFVNQNEQPVLIVNDLLSDASEGAIGLWIASGTDAHFANVRYGPLGSDEER
ncbi:hypothetical protein [Erythrobacter mangrovi]|uniref:DUF1080 domain-containing protein n=1 Tax=Erythrobacter mangrovi TaxID=2739433 RepID=A0A7D3XQ07_9SPHN|nr:hypothetical protein [Erythrobacter mangrovi]QKG71154.1 hypothetical protein HQR01_07040 [Erythrobacter mangrovi]